MTIKQLEYFLEVARTLNFSEAAKNLYVTQPALSRSITALEQELDSALLIRSRHGIELTAAGAVLANALPRLGSNLSQVMVEVQQTDEGQRGKVRLGVLDGVNISPRLRDAMENFRQRLPNVDLFPVCLTMEDLILSVREHTTDLIYSYDTGASDSSLRSIELGRDRFCLAVAADSRFAQAEHIDLRDLRTERIFLAGTESSFELHRWKELFSAAGIMPRFATVLNTSTLMFCVENGFGVALMPENHSIFMRPGVRQVGLNEVFSLQYSLKWDPANLNPCIDLFLNAIRNTDG